MKSNLKHLAVILLIMSMTVKTFSQPWQTNLGNIVGVASYLGTTNAQPLRLKTTQNQPINFFTGTNGFQRMTIRGQAGPTQGFVGIGNGFTTPVSLLHLNETTTNQAFIQFTNTISGNSNSTKGVKVGIASNGNAEFHNYVVNSPQPNNTYVYC